MLVDDDRDAREFVRVCLQRSGARVNVAGSVADAALHLKDEIDLLITDIAMPDDETRLALAGFDRHLAEPAEAGGLMAAVTALVKPGPAV